MDEPLPPRRMAPSRVSSQRTATADWRDTIQTPRVRPTRRTNGPSRSSFGRSSMRITPDDQGTEKAPRSMWDQVNPISMASQAVQGVASLAREVVEMPFHMAQLPIDIARAAGAPLPGESGMDWSGNPLQDIQAVYREYNPLLADIATSVNQTSDVMGLGYGAQENVVDRYRTAVDEGRWVDELLTDAGNVAIVAGGLGKLAGSVASASVMPEASSLLRRAAAGERGVAGTTVIDSAVPRSLSSAYRTAETVLPPRLPLPTEAPLRLPGQAPRVVKLSRAPVEGARLPEIVAKAGTGVAGRIERAARPGMSPAEIFAADAVPAAQTVAKVGDAARRVSLGAQWLDPVDSLVGTAERVIGRGTHGLARVTQGDADAPTRVSSGASRAAAKIEQYRNEADIRQAAQDVRETVRKAAHRPQFYVDESLKRLGMDEPTRNLYGGVILDATDKSLDTYADVWRDLPQRSRDATLRQWNALRPERFELTAEQLDLYNRYRDSVANPEAGLIDPEVTKVLTEGLDQIRSNEEIRRTYQRNAGNLLGEQLDEPMVVLDDGKEIPYYEATADQRALAARKGQIKYPWLESRAAPELQARLAKVAQAQEKVDAQVEAMRPLKREVDLYAQQRAYLPKPGRNVAWADTPEGRAEMIAENRARLTELEQQGAEPGVWAALAGGEPLTRPQALADAAARAVERSIIAEDMPDPVIGTNPTPPGQWTPGTWDDKVYPRDEVVEMRRLTGGELGEPRRPVAEQIIQAEAVARYKLDQAGVELRKVEWKLQQAKIRADTFYEQLNRSQQEMIGEVSRRGVNSYRAAVRQVNPSGRDVGRWEVDPRTKTPVISGLVGDLAHRLGIYDQLFEIVDEVRFREYSRQYEAYKANHPNTAKDPAMSFDEYVDFRLRKDDIPNIAYDLLIERADQLTDPEARRIWSEARDELDQAYVADVLDRFLKPFYAPDAAMAGHAAYTELQSKIGSLPENLRRHVGTDVELAINDAYDKYRERFHRELKESVNRNLAYVPARLRTPLQEARRANLGLYEEAAAQWKLGTQEGRDVAEALYRMTEHTPTSMAMYVAQNKAVPIHLIAGDGTAFRRRPRPVNAPAEVTVATPLGAHARERGMRLRTLREYSQLEAKEMTNIAAQQSVMAMATDPTFSRSVAQVPGLAEWLAQRQKDSARPVSMRELEEALAEIDPNQQWAVVKNATPAATPDATGKMATIIANEPARADIVPASGERLDQVLVTNPQTGEPILVNFDELDNLNRIPEIRVVPAYLSKVLDDYLNPNSNKWLVMYDQMTQLWKTATLAWSVAWVTYNAIGNALMATFSYGQSPVALVKNIGDIRRELRAMNESAGFGSNKPFRTSMKYDTLSAAVPTRMGAHGPSWAERLSTMQATDDATRLGRTLEYVTEGERSWIGKVTEFSYTLNEFTDNMFRTSVLMEDVSKRLAREAPIKREWLNSDGTLRTDLSVAETRELADVSAAANAALDRSVRAALNTMGDFTRLTRFERNVVKRVFPFYPWLRHQTAMAFRMPLQNPMRWAWMQSLADLLADEDMGDEMNALMAPMMMTPLGAISMSAANPFGKGMTGFGSSNEGSSILDPQSMLAAVNPIPKTLASLVTGIDFNQGAAASRPSDQKFTNDYGQEVGGSALTRLQRDPLGALGEIGYTALNLTPQTRGLRDTLLGPAPRYDSGDVISYADDRAGGRIGSLARAARIPFLPTDITHLTEVATTKDQEAQRAARRRRLLSGSNG